MSAVPLSLDLSLSWDLLVIVFFAIVVAYSFIMGKHESVKIIIATYISILAIQGLGNAIADLMIYGEGYFTLLGFSGDLSFLSVLKLAGFVATIIFIENRGGFDVEYNKDLGSMADTLLVGAFGFSTAGLLMVTLLTFVAGSPLLDPNLEQASALQPILASSTLVKTMIDYQNIWFALPAMLLIGLGFFSHESE